MFLCIDLKSFYASVECAIRGLDTLKTNLVVADEKRGKGALCLAVSPSLKALGVRNRCRLYEIPNYLNYIIAKPRMGLYIKYSVMIYKIYLKYISSEDIHPYSIDEVFLDISSYLNYYKISCYELAFSIMNAIKKQTGIIATCGIGENMYLAKVALDILAKKSRDNIGYLDKDLYLLKLSLHEPLTDFWQIGTGIMLRLLKYNIKNMKDIRTANVDLLHHEFGINANILIEHANGRDETTIANIKQYNTKSKSLSLSQILFSDYSFVDARNILKEMVFTLVLSLINNELCTGLISLHIGYADIKSFNKQKMIYSTNCYSLICKEFLYLYDKFIKKEAKIRQVSISLSLLKPADKKDYNLFTNEFNETKEINLLKAINEIKIKYGKNSLLTANNLLKMSTQKTRNELIGGHHE